MEDLKIQLQNGKDITLNPNHTTKLLKATEFSPLPRSSESSSKITERSEESVKDFTFETKRSKSPNKGSQDFLSSLTTGNGGKVDNNTSDPIADGGTPKTKELISFWKEMESSYKSKI